MLELYHVIVRLGIHDGVTRGVTSLGARFKHTAAEAEALQAKISKIKTTLLAGAGMTFLGGLGIYATTKLLKPAEQYTHLLVQANAMGLTHKQIAESITAAWKTTAQVQTVSLNQALGMVLDLRAAVGGVGRAIIALPTAARLVTAFAMAQAEPGAGGAAATESPTQMVYGLYKAEEMLGKTRDPVTLNRNVAEFTRAVIAMRGRISTRAMQMTIKYMRGAAPGFSEAFLYTTLPVFMQEAMIGKGFGAARGGPGAALRSLAQVVSIGAISKKRLGLWAALGLTKQPGLTKLTAKQQEQYKVMYKQMYAHPFVPKTKAQIDVLAAASPFKHAALELSDPFLYMKKYLLPTLKKRYPKITPEQISSIINKLYPGLSAWPMTMMAVRMKLFTKYRGIFKGVLPIGELMQLGRKDPEVVKMLLGAQWENVRTMLARSFIVVVLPILVRFAGWMNKFAGFLKQHPNLGKDLIEALYLLSGALAFSGVVLLLKGAFMGLGVVMKLLFASFELGGLATGLGEIAMALGALYLIVTHWTALYKFITGLEYKATTAMYWFGAKTAGADISKAAFAKMPAGEQIYWSRMHGGKYADWDVLPISGMHTRPKTEHHPESHVYLDGRIVGKLVAKQIGKRMSLIPNANGTKSSFDTALNLPGTAYNLKNG